MRFKTISELYATIGASPEHPLFSLYQFNESQNGKFPDTEITHDFYVMCLKKIESGDFLYGKTKYDSDTGFMYFFKPGQSLSLHNVVIREPGFTIYLHEDYLMGHPLFSEIRDYSFFDYEIHEALHLTPKEKDIMWSIYHKMESEYNNNQDEFSKSIILSHLDSLLKYAQRFYKRQFIDRKPMSGVTVTKFNSLLKDYFASSDIQETGLPTVKHMAALLNLSPKYLSDLLKQETGKTALELIHLHVISEAKNQLIEGKLSVAEIAYRLGFENPPYFSRLFKKEVGMTPVEFVTQHRN